jgi:hypothetical protein
MRRFLAWLTCAAGAAWIVRRLRRSAPEPALDPADELRRTLDASRTAEPPPAEPAEPTEAEAPDLDERRRAVHERGRAAIDEMRGEGGSSE